MADFCKNALLFDIADILKVNKIIPVCDNVTKIIKNQINTTAIILL